MIAAKLAICCLLVVGQYPPEWLPAPRPVPAPARPATSPELVRLIQNSDLVLKRDVTIDAVKMWHPVEAGSSKRVLLHFLVPPADDRRTYPQGSIWRPHEVVSKTGEKLAAWSPRLTRPALMVDAKSPAPMLLWSPQGQHAVTRSDVELLFDIVPKPPLVVELR